MSALKRAAATAVARHVDASTPFTAAGVRSSVLRSVDGSGTPVVLMHGVPTSSFLYRRVVPELGDRGIDAVAFDLPGMGLAERPIDFDYRWTGLGEFAVAALDALGIERCHLVVHDIGGPVGFEMVHRLGDRVASLTVLNTMVSVATFRKPWMMAPFAVPLLGRLWLAAPARVFVALLRWIGVADQDAVSDAELLAHLHLVRGTDRGTAFLRIMRSFQTTEASEQRYRAVLADRSRPVQVLWGTDDAALPMRTHGAQIADLTGTAIIPLHGKHFVQEDNSAAIARHIAEFIGGVEP